MAYDVAKLRMEVDTSGLVRGEQALKKFGATAKSMGSETDTLARKTKKMGAETDTFVGKIKSADARVAGLVKSAKGLSAALAAVGAGAAAMAALSRAAAQAGQFGTALAEVSTLIEGTPAQMQKLRQESIRLSNTYGGSATRNAKAFYQAISAGAGSIEEAAAAVDVANKLAVGGVTDVTTAMAGLMGSINAYKDAGLTAMEASDALFTGMRLGTTTIGELASSLGRVAPFAKAVGLSFDELVASVSIATKGGIETSEAVSGLKAALDNITKPSIEAAALSEKLGLNFGAAALEGRTFVEFLGDLREKTGGSAEALNKLFGSIEGKTLVMALTGAGFNDLSGAMGEFAEKTGETDASVEKMADTLENRLARAMATIDNAGMGPGQLWLTLKVNVAEAAAGIVTSVQGMIGDVRAAIEGEWRRGWALAVDVVDKANLSIGAIMARTTKSAAASVWDWVNNLKNAQPEFVSGAQQISKDMAEAGSGIMQQFGEGFAAGVPIAISKAEEAMNEAFAAIDAKMSGDNMLVAGTEAIADAAERAKIEFVHIGEVAGGAAWGGIKKAADEAAVLADNLKEAASYMDGTAPGTGNAGDGYAGVSGGSWFDQPSTMPSMSFQIYIPEERPLEEYFSFVEGNIKDLDRQLERFVRENSGVLNEAILAEGADPLAFWQSFRTLAIDSYGSIIENLFSDNGAATNVIAKSLENILNANIDMINANIQKFNEAVRNIDVNDAIRRMPGGSLVIDLDKFRDMEDEYFNTSRELLGSWLRGHLGGRDGSKSDANLTTKFQITRKVVDPTNPDGDPVLRTYNQKEVKDLGAIGRVFGDIVGNIQDKISLFANVIGGNLEGMAKIVHWFEIDLGKDAKAGGKLSQLVLQEFEDYSDKLAKRVLRGREDLQRAGESWTDTLERLADDFLGVSATLLFMGQNQLQRANLNNAGYASDLAALFGGVEAFNESAMAFFNVAYNPEQQNAAIQDYVDSTLAGAGIKRTPTTRQEYQDMVEGFDLSTKRGREKYAALVQLAGLFDMILPAWEDTADVTDDAAAAAEAYNDAMSSVSGALNGMIIDARSAAREFGRLSESLADAAQSIRGLGRNDADTLASLRQQFGGLYRQSKNGDADAMADLGGVAADYAKAFAGQATSAAEYQFFVSGLAAKLDEISGVAAEQADMSQYEEQSLQALLDAVANGELTNQLVLDTIAAIGALDDGILAGLRAIFEYNTGETPGFASGGNHRGGYRIVGERGPELEATGPARIHSNAQTRALLGIDDLRKDLDRMHTENRSLNIKIEKHGRKLEQMLTKWDIVGQPPERAA